MKRTLPLLLACVAAASPALHAQERAQVFQGARILPITSEPIENGVLVVREGRIVASIGRAEASEERVMAAATGAGRVAA